MPVHAFIFPGQGSQTVGMGRDLAAAFPAAREVFEEVDEALKQRLSKLMFEGSAEDLTLTENTQPALMAVSMAVLRVLEREGGFMLQDKAALVLGHSLGEYSALAAAGTFTLGDAARLLKRRGLAMQRAAPAGEGAMAALLGADLAQAQAICADAAVLRCEDGTEQTQVIEPANDNGGGQVVISGDRAAVERAVALAKQRGVRRAHAAAGLGAVPLQAHGPGRRRHAGRARPRPRCCRPAVPLIANVSAERALDPGRDPHPAGPAGHLHGALARVHAGGHGGIGVDSFVELGAGKVLSSLAKRSHPDAPARSLPARLPRSKPC